MLTFDRPTLVTITAPTCSGKNFLRDMMELHFEWDRLVSTTTRAPRAGEVEGSDYYFISREQSLAMEARGEFEELIEFRGTRYGVTKDEMRRKMNSKVPATVILEPQGLEVYRKLCIEQEWDMFSIFIYATEKLRIERLMQRTVKDIENGIAPDAAVKSHTDRVLSIVGDERSWSQIRFWDALVPGDDVEKALDMIARGVTWKNRKNETPKPYDHYAK